MKKLISKKEALRRARISTTMKGRRPSDANIAAVRAANSGRPSHLRGIPKTAEHRAKISAAMMGRELTPENLANIKAANARRRGKPVSAAVVARSVAGRAHLLGIPLTPEHRMKISRAMTGRIQDPAHTAAIVAAQQAALDNLPAEIRAIVLEVATEFNFPEDEQQ